MLLLSLLGDKSGQLKGHGHNISWHPMCNVKPLHRCIGQTWRPSGKSPSSKLPGCLPPAKHVCAADPACVGVWSAGDKGCVRMTCHGVKPGVGNCVYLRPSEIGSSGDSSMPAYDLVALRSRVANFEGSSVAGTKVLNHTMRRDENAVTPCCLSSRRRYDGTDCSASAVAARAHTLVLIQHPSMGLGSSAARLRGLILLATLAACGFNVTTMYTAEPTKETLASAGLVGRTPGGLTVLSLRSETAAHVHRMSGMPSWTSGLLGQKEKLLGWLRSSAGLGHLTPRNVPAPAGGWHRAEDATLKRLRYPLVLKFPARDGHSSGVRMTHGPDEMERAVSEMRRWAGGRKSDVSERDELLGQLVVQEVILGKDEVTINFSARDGVLLAAFCLRYNHPNAAAGLPVRFKDKVAKTTVKCDQQHLLPALAQVVRHTSYTGVP